MIRDKLVLGLGLALLLALGFAVWYKLESVGLERDLRIMTVKYEQSEANTTTLNTALEGLSYEISSKAINIKESEKRYFEAVSKLKRTEVKSNECEAIKSMLDDIRSNGY